ncbi:MAG: DUF86 domain-containing protein [bacterium]|nr:DUF86 domain-containing protein [bacterium]
MSKKRDIKILVQDIEEDIYRIEKFTEQIKNKKQFAENDLVFYAVLKALENIGEAVKHIPDDLKQSYDIEWKKISGMRDIIIHEYFGIDAEIIWDIIKNKLPKLKKAIQSINS